MQISILQRVMIMSLSIAQPLAAEPLDGNTVYSACISTDDLVQQGFCIGWVIGQIEGENSGAFLVLNQIAEYKSAAEVNPVIEFFLNRCIPNAVDNRQLRDVVVQYLERHPETRHQPARWLANRALAEAFPCPLE